MSCRLAIWCPHGRDALPLAAQLFLAQIPASQVVWSSDEAEPTPPPATVSAEAWLVLAEENLPAVPEWRWRPGSRWWLFPGSAVNWNEHTAQALEAWRPDELLSDLLPEELGGQDWIERWSRWPLRWLPARIQAPAATKSRIPLLVVIDAGFPSYWVDPYLQALADAHGGQVVHVSPGKRALQAPGFGARAEALLVCSTDPVFHGLVAQGAGRHGTPVFVLGSKPAWWRGELLDAEVQWSWDHKLPGEHLVPTVRSISAAIGRAKRTTRGNASAPSWTEWLATVSAPPGRGPFSDAAAELLPAVADLRRHAAFPELAREWQALIPEWHVEGLLFAGLSNPELAPLRRGLLDRLQYLTPGVPAGRVWRSLTAVSPGWLALAIEGCAAEGAHALGCTLFTFAADEHGFGSRSDWVAAAARLFERALGVTPDAPYTLACAATTAALLGDLPRADAFLGRLRAIDAAMNAQALNRILRAWIGLRDAEENGRVPAGAQAWWQAHADALAEGHSGLWLQAARGALWWGDFAGVEWRLQRAAPTPAQDLGTAVVAWLKGDAALASRLLARAGVPAAGAAWVDRFAYLCAVVLVAGRGDDVIATLAELDAAAPDFFNPTVPSSSRCFFRALVYRRTGDEASAQHWWRRACAEDALAVHRTPIFERVKALALA